MHYKLLGTTGLRVSELCLGAMTFGTEWEWGATKEDSRAVFDRYIEAGGNFLDTAVNYTKGSSELFLGEFIQGMREKLVIATKYSLSTRPGDLNSGGNHKKNLVQSLEQSLRSLNTEYIDLFYVHVWDGTSSLDEVMRALDDQVRLGKILHIGISDTPAWIISAANVLAEQKSWTPFSAVQLKYSMLERSAEADLFPMAEYFGMSVTTWGILGGGILSGKYNKASKTQSEGRFRHSKVKSGEGVLKDKNIAIAKMVGNIAKEVGCTPSQAAIAWQMYQNEAIIPIIGARSVEQLEDNLGALEVELGELHLSQIEDNTAIEQRFPNNFIESDFIRNLIFAGAEEKLHH